MPRFVVLQHDHPVLHWDFMLESNGALRTWRLAAAPTAETTIAATALGEHRLAYLDYEGPVSGNRGTVTQWDQGDFDYVEQKEDHLAVRLNGRRLFGTASLVRAGIEWSFQFVAQR